jgi:hypothetical protein
MSDDNGNDLKERFGRIAPSVGGAARAEETRIPTAPAPVEDPPPAELDEQPTPDMDQPQHQPGGIGFAFLLPQVWASVDNQRITRLMARVMEVMREEHSTPLEAMALGSMLQAMGVADPQVNVPPHFLLYDLHMQVVNQTSHYLRQNAEASTPSDVKPS